MGDFWTIWGENVSERHESGGYAESPLREFDNIERKWQAMIIELALQDKSENGICIFIQPHKFGNTIRKVLFISMLRMGFQKFNF